MFRNYLRKSGVTASFVIAIASMGLRASAQTLTPPSVPAEIQVPAGNTVYLKAYAEGTQNYVCLPSGSGLAWKFQGPQATLFLKLRWFNSEVRQQIMTHFLSPNPMEGGTARATWQSSIDTSLVWAVKVGESSDSSFVAPGAIPWFLLDAVGTQHGPTGGAMLTPTTYIQRVNTTGGIMPPNGCSVVGSIAFVPYTAEYVFYRASQ
jgi:hypothetical protein